MTVFWDANFVRKFTFLCTPAKQTFVKVRLRIDTPWVFQSPDLTNEGAGCYSPSSFNWKWLLKSKAEAFHPKDPYRLHFSFMKFLIRIYTCDIPLNFFHKILRVLSSVRHFFSVAHHTPPIFLHKMMRTFTTEAPFFSVARNNKHGIALLYRDS